MFANQRFAHNRALAMVLALLDFFFRVVRPAQRMAIDPTGPIAIGTCVLFIAIFALVWLLSVRLARMPAQLPQSCRKERRRDEGRGSANTVADNVSGRRAQNLMLSVSVPIAVHRHYRGGRISRRPVRIGRCTSFPARKSSANRRTAT